jgi:hypothetical protein
MKRDPILKILPLVKNQKKTKKVEDLMRIGQKIKKWIPLKYGIIR